MGKAKVKQCVRPQCRLVYPEEYTGRYCDCGAILQLAEIDIKYRKYRSESQKEEQTNIEVKETADESEVKDTMKESLSQENMNESVSPEIMEEAESQEKIHEFETAVNSELAVVETPEYGNGYLYLILDNDEEIEYKLGKEVYIGRNTDSISVDIDLSEYTDKVSRKHVVIKWEAGGYYLTNLSETYSVHIEGKAIAYGEKKLLQSEDSILLSRTILFLFIEGE